MSKFLLTLSGVSGSGKSTIAKMLTEHFHLQYVNNGQLLREMGKEMGFSNILSFDTYVQKHPEIDQELDKRTVEFAKTHDHALLEGRLTGWMCHRHNIEAFKIFLTADLSIRAKRLAKRDNQTEEEAKQSIADRDAGHIQRYKDVYNIDINDTSIYNLVIQTDTLTPQEIFNIISEQLKKEGLI